MNAVEIDASGEDVGIVRKTHRREIAAITPSPKADALGIDVGAGLQIFSGGYDVLIFAGATPGPIRSLAKGAPVADAAAIVDGKNDVAAIREVLVHRVGVRVVVHVMPAEKHLPHGAAMDEDERGKLFTGLEVFRKKKLAMD